MYLFCFHIFFAESSDFFVFWVAGLGGYT
ncbi:hypothetical protein RSK20926_13994 [Roseobacter sp. SK209-2-6]|nr:hypothetical protein RSK20926_00105 [Roseobacter sp. SK209-2-6]EBA15748.1 hypothetical protein RSK20926_13994 [Roseobacter sp. SK209-2-6]